MVEAAVSRILFKPSPPVLAISLKLYFSPSPTQTYLSSLVSLVSSHPSFPGQLIYIPDFLNLQSCASKHPTSTSRIHYGAQDGHWEDEGAWTGEVSMRSLREVGCAVVELGHAERRRHFGETNEVVAKKCAAAVRNGLVPLLCIGELEQASLEESVQFLKTQLVDVFSTVSPSENLILAYEPVWAIGQPKPAPTSHIVDIGLALRQYLKEEGRGDTVKMLYGGSAGPGLWKEIGRAVDGMFLGRFAHVVSNVEVVMGEMEEGVEEGGRGGDVSSQRSLISMDVTDMRCY